MIPNINLTHLKYFYDTVLLNSVSAAARENYVSQSAISQGITKLEQALKVTLTTHQRQSFKLTDEGTIVFREAKKILLKIQNLKSSLNELKSEISGDVHFACTNTIGQFFLAANYLKIRREYPLLNLNFMRGGLPFIHEMLKNEKVSFSLAVNTPAFSCYEKKVIHKGKFHLYKAKVSMENEGIFVDHPETFEVIQLRKLYLETYKKELVIQESLLGWGMVTTFVLNGSGIGFLPDFIFLRNENVEKVDLGIPEIEYEICAFYLKGNTLSIASEAVLSSFMEKPIV